MHDVLIDREIGYLLLARAEIDAPADKGWYHTVPPPGEYPSKIRRKGKLIDGTLVVDEEAYRRIEASFAARAAQANFPGLIVDLEHHSEEPGGSTEAAAWALAMRRGPDGIYTRWEKTDLGETIIGSRYRMRSPAFDLELLPGTRDRYRPVDLLSIGLTNTPHFKNLAPSLNRAVQEEGSVDMLQRLQTLLKMPATADQEAVCSAIEALVKKNETDNQALATAQKRVTDLETVERTREADAFIALHKGRIKDETAVRAAYLKDPETCKGLYGALKPIDERGGKAPRLLGKDAQTPKDGETAMLAARIREKHQLIAAIQTRDGCKRTVALATAERERPDLFGKEEKGA